MSKFFIRSDTARVAFPDGEWADIKAEFSQEDMDHISSRMMQAKMSTNGKPHADVQMAFGKQATLERAIVAWSFAEDNLPIPVTPENISNLRTKYRLLILAEVNRLSEEAAEFSKNSLRAST